MNGFIHQLGIIQDLKHMAISDVIWNYGYVTKVNRLKGFAAHSSLTIDTLGNVVRTTEHKAHYDAAGDSYEDVVMKYEFDYNTSTKSDHCLS